MSAIQRKLEDIHDRQELADELWRLAQATGEGFSPSTWTGHWRDWYLLRADERLAARNTIPRNCEEKPNGNV